MITKGIRISQLVERKDLNGKEIIPFQDGIHNGKLSIQSLIDYMVDISDSALELQALIKIQKFVDTVSEMDLLLYQAKEGDIYYCKENKKLYVRSFNKWDMLDPLISKVYVLVGLDKYNRTNIIHLWDGNDMVVMSERLFIGEVTGTAYDGGKGKHLADIANSLPDNVIREVADFTTDGSTVTFNYEYDVKQKSGLFDGDAQGSKTIPSATTSNAGVMSATDKVKVDKIVTDGDGNKYLTDNGNYQELIEDTTETIKTTDAIPVAGGPLADLLNKAGINSISPDTSMQDLFVSLFTKELWPTNFVFKEGTVSAAIAAPSFTLSNTGLVEVGATVTIGKTTLSAATMSTTARTYSGFTYGYSSSNDNTKDSSNTTITVNASNVALNSVNYTMKRTTNGSVENATANTNHAQVTLDSKTFKAIEGTNTVKVDITGPTANATFASMPVYYACSNLGKTNEKHKTEPKGTTTKTSTIPSNSKTLNVTGVYPYYTNKDNIKTFAKLGLTTNKTLDVTFVAETASNKHAFKIPAKFNVTKITLLNTLSGKYEDYSVSRFSVTTETINVQGTNVQYKVYTRNDGTNGSSSFKITFA